jgi:hypothetical protein
MSATSDLPLDDIPLCVRDAPLLVNTNDNTTIPPKLCCNGLSTEAIKVGDYLSCVNYYKVTDVNPGGVSLKTLVGDFGSLVHREILSNEYRHVKHYRETRAVNPTTLAEIVQEFRSDICFLVFEKTIKQPDVEKLITSALEEHGNALSTGKPLKALAKAVMKGERREMICRYVGPGSRGFLRVMDLEKGEERQVNERTLEEIILRGVRYVKKTSTEGRKVMKANKERLTRPPPYSDNSSSSKRVKTS